MDNKTKGTILFVVILGVGLIWFFNAKQIVDKIGEQKNSDKITADQIESDDSQKEFAFLGGGLNTNTAKTSISLDKVLDGGPGKDGIPALSNPKFVSVREAEKTMNNDVDGLVVSAGKKVKFYPYNIMVWHEIVNDIVGGKPLVVTFCPLCGSAIVFDAEVKGKIEQFGVSGKLFESNLLMYDKTTESLWSQSIGTAVVGDRIGEKLTVFPSQVLSFGVFQTKWPDGEVLSANTGFSRNYNFYPYGDYDENETIYFPISVNDNRLPAKEIMYVVNAYNHSVAFQVKKLSETSVSLDVGGGKVVGTIIDGEIVVKDNTGKTLPGYHEMWFSWAIHHQQDGIVWKGE
jgi:hypothetical protein